MIAGTRIKGRTKAGFTVIELCVVILIFTMLVALLFPAIRYGRESSHVSVCQNNLRQIGVGLASYHASNDRFPAGRDARGARQHSWATMILPFTGQQPLFDRYSFEHPWNESTELVHNRDVAETLISLYRCPSTSHSADGEGDYGGNYGSTLTGLKAGFAPWEAWSSGVLVAVNIPGIKQKPIGMRDIRDGVSQTLLVVECAGLPMERAGGWANGHHCVAHDHGGVNSFRSLEIFGDHAEGANCLVCDGSTHFLSSKTAPEMIGALSCRSGGESPDVW